MVNRKQGLKFEPHVTNLLGSSDGWPSCSLYCYTSAEKKGPALKYFFHPRTTLRDVLEDRRSSTLGSACGLSCLCVPGGCKAVWGARWGSCRTQGCTEFPRHLEEGDLIHWPGDSEEEVRRPPSLIKRSETSEVLRTVVIQDIFFLLGDTLNT